MKNDMYKTLADVLICPKCNSDECYEIGTDEIEFDPGGKGHYYVDCTCPKCKTNFRLCFNFEYNITESWVRS